MGEQIFRNKVLIDLKNIKQEEDLRLLLEIALLVYGNVIIDIENKTISI